MDRNQRTKEKDLHRHRHTDAYVDTGAPKDSLSSKALNMKIKRDIILQAVSEKLRPVSEEERKLTSSVFWENDGQQHGGWFKADRMVAGKESHHQRPVTDYGLALMRA